MEQIRRTFISRLKPVLDALATIGVIVACGALTWGIVTGRLSAGTRQPTGGPTAAPARPQPPLPTEPVSLKGAALKGDSGSSVAVLEFSEFQCPFCAKFVRETWPSLDAKYVTTGKVQWAFRHLPLEKIHANAFRAAEAAVCAGEQQRFWPMHALLFQNQQLLSREALDIHAARAGVAKQAFTSCLDGGRAQTVRADMAMASALGISGTPAFLVGRVEPNGLVRIQERVTGAVSVGQFEAALDKVLGG